MKRRLLAALDEPDRDDWLEWCEYKLRKHANWSRRTKLYDISTVGLRIKTAREVMGMRVKDFAYRMGVTPALVRAWERGLGAIPAEKIPGMAMCLGVKRAWLLMESDEGGPPLPHEVLRRPIDSWAKRRMTHAKGEEKRRRLAEVRARAAAAKST